MPTSIETLARHKSFSALSAEERDRVLTEMPPEAYDQLHRVLQTAPQLEATQQPPDRLRTHLMARMTATKPNRGWRRVALRPLPAWQVAAALLAGIALTMPWRSFTPVEKVVTLRETVTDTVFVTKVEWRDRVVVRYLTRPTPEKPPVAPMASALDPIPQELPETAWQPTAVGTSLGDAPELMGFFTQGDER
jgi:hypothetical protein